MSSQVRELQIRRFIIDSFLFGEDGDSLGNEDSFLQKGIIDSTGVLELLSFLEETYRVKVDDAELVPENLDSVNRLLNFLSRKLDGDHSAQFSESLARTGASA